MMSEELLLNINHRLASNSFMLSPGLSELLIEFQEKALSLVVIAILQGVPYVMETGIFWLRFS